MPLASRQPVTSPQEYLEGELHSAIKHELIDGQVYDMAGASKNHDRIAANLMRHLGNHLDGAPCEPFTADMKVKAGEDFFYPDLMVVCHDDSAQVYYTEAPVLIVEVLSKATRKTDQVLKRRAYQQLPSLEEYVLIEQDIVDVEVCRRGNHWQSEHYYLGDLAWFASIDLHLAVADIYARVVNGELPPTGDAP